MASRQNEFLLQVFHDWFEGMCLYTRKVFSFFTRVNLRDVWHAFKFFLLELFLQKKKLKEWRFYRDSKMQLHMLVDNLKDFLHLLFSFCHKKIVLRGISNLISRKWLVSLSHLSVCGRVHPSIKVVCVFSIHIYT